MSLVPSSTQFRPPAPAPLRPPWSLVSRPWPGRLPCCSDLSAPSRPPWPATLVPRPPTRAPAAPCRGAHGRTPPSAPSSRPPGQARSTGCSSAALNCSAGPAPLGTPRGSGTPTLSRLPRTLRRSAPLPPGKSLGWRDAFARPSRSGLTTHGGPSVGWPPPSTAATPPDARRPRRRRPLRPLGHAMVAGPTFLPPGPATTLGTRWAHRRPGRSRTCASTGPAAHPAALRRLPAPADATQRLRPGRAHAAHGRTAPAPPLGHHPRPAASGLAGRSDRSTFLSPLRWPRMAFAGRRALHGRLPSSAAAQREPPRLSRAASHGRQARLAEALPPLRHACGRLPPPDALGRPDRRRPLPRLCWTRHRQDRRLGLVLRRAN